MAGSHGLNGSWWPSLHSRDVNCGDGHKRKHNQATVRSIAKTFRKRTGLFQDVQRAKKVLRWQVREVSVRQTGSDTGESRARR